jgi:DNA-binding PadR family transcriptional regulator
MTQANPSTFLPLREPTFFILLSLFPSEKHGYAILKEVEALSEGSLHLSTGTLYEALSRLLDQGLIERVEEEVAGAGPGKPRKVYRLTHLGRQVIEAEAARLQTLAFAARRQMGDAWKGNALTT